MPTFIFLTIIIWLIIKILLILRKLFQESPRFNRGSMPTTL